jgi:predicted alpha-1,2-mannosidase
MKSKTSVSLVLPILSLLFLRAEITQAATPLVTHVNILQGTDSDKDLSHGNTLPLVGMPWGMVAWSIQNARGENGRWFFQPNGTFEGFRATHQPSPWMGDYGQFLIVPDLARSGPGSITYDTNTAVLQPDYERLDLLGGAITAELTATESCGVFRITFKEGAAGRLRLKSFGEAEFKIAGRKVYGVSRVKPRGTPQNFGVYFVLSLDRDITLGESDSSGIFNPGAKFKEVHRCVDFKTSPNKAVLLKVATSFISWEQAEQNLHAETEGDFDSVHQRVAAVWNERLGRMEIEADPGRNKTFYSCLYHALMFPQRMFELDASGKPIHYSPYDGKIHDGVLYGNIGIWDAFRTTFPLLTLVYTGQLNEILQGFVAAAKEGDGTLPEWPSPGYRRCMIGQHCAAIFADALAKGQRGFDVDAAYESLRKSAFTPPSPGMLVRDGMESYLQLGYTPGIRYSVSTALDYAYDDWCVARMARLLNHPDVETTLMARAQNYRKLWDSSVGFMRDRKPDGSWVEPFDEFAWGGPYAESGPWQASWFVPHDPAGLASLLGGRDQFAAKLDRLMSQPPTFHVGGYGHPIHEMVEMSVIPFGQCSLGNQPAFGIPYLVAAIGQPWKTQYWTRRACRELFNSTPRGFPGDEDNGSTASWYILSSIGLYPGCPGTPEYIVTCPLYSKVVLHLAERKTLKITASSNSEKNVYIQKRRFNGRTDSKVCISHQDLIRGGELHFQMGPEPKSQTRGSADLPYSASSSE